MKSTRFTVVLCMAACLATVASGTLWLRERQRKPIQVIKEVQKPVESSSFTWSGSNWIRLWSSVATEISAKSPRHSGKGTLTAMRAVS
jgi:hypothetical protein